jgi:hypothetical protein
MFNEGNLRIKRTPRQKISRAGRVTAGARQLFKSWAGTERGPLPARRELWHDVGLEL